MPCCAATRDERPLVRTRSMLGRMSEALQHPAWSSRLAVHARRARPAAGIALLDWALVGGLLVLAAWLTPMVTDPTTDYAPPIVRLGGHWRDASVLWALQLVMVLALLWRRRWPFAVFAAVAAAAFLQWLAGPQLIGDLAVLVALYTVVAYEPRPIAVWGAVGLGGFGLLLALQRWAIAPGANAPAAVSLIALFAVPLAFGVATRNRRRLIELGRAEAVAQERARIAREMHDVVTHNLAVMVALADGARLSVDRDPAAARVAVAHIARTGREGLHEMRGLLGVLRDPDAAAPLQPQPGLDALDDLARPLRAAGIAVEVTTTGDVAGVAAGPALAVHRIVQEALTNVLRHAPQARTVHVRVRCEETELVALVQDDGGPTTAARAADGSGLRGMAHRADLHGGALEAGPAGAGWRVVVMLPLHREPPPR